jgi:hypothetical protein
MNTMKMSKELYDWLRFRWYKDNHPKYQHLFFEWVDNVTDDQILGFSKQERRRNIYG